MSLPKNPEKFTEFLKLLNYCYQLSDEKLNDIQNTYAENEYDEFYELFELIEGSFDNHWDDWRFYSEDLCDYIGKRINQQFFIDDEEVQGDINVVINHLENQTEYSLLGLESGSDDINIWVVKKSDRPTLLELAKSLGLMAY
ncbi:MULTISPECIES: hypothetical protein [Moraxella]|uniref:DUF6630 domain-containing protein n=1 Tax=Moraxella lacunata TaxID=477 RepID=A0A1B8Q4A6_MORLA|nr:MULTISPECIES: hypothetical protein [Moraxella]MBE9579012.1 hypothetical protein [Moraxella sp. K1664]MBE9588347.1 hypothetical protein [Moraxella sp. K1630]MBE9596511.1 hypothetical protein [Moraxella sp. K2450]MDH9218900.1 hypothetical protein [Moraxella lacunata]MDI4483053.1 hypothetical protein [Moraxella lacunata]